MNTVQMRQCIADKLIDAQSAQKQPQFLKTTDAILALKEPNFVLQKTNAWNLA